MASRSRKADEALLTRIRTTFDYEMAYWREIRKERQADMRVVAGDIWPDDERSARSNGTNPRLCLDLDEVNQYLNSCVNEVRGNTRAVKVNPKGSGASDELAQLRQGIIRGIEYESKAPRTYANAFQAAVEGSYGAWKLKNVYENEDSMDQVLRICPILDPDTILLDSSAKELDYSDAKHAFEVDSYSEDEFRKRWPTAEILSFSSEIQKEAPAWIQAGEGGGKRIQVASFWDVECESRVKVLMEDGSKKFLDEFEGAKFTKDQDLPEFNRSGKGGFVELPDKRVLRAIDWRDVDSATVCQYITNGIEILEENPWDGKTIPIYPVFGKRIYVNKGAGSKLIILSLVRLARPAVLLYCYARTAQAELAGMMPKIPLIGYEGQFATNTPWEDLNKIPLGYAEVKAKTAATGDAVLPKPEWQQWEPPIQALEILAVAAQRAIQSAMGITGLLTGQRGQSRDAKSGVALKELDEQASQGTYHFVDSLDAAIERTGREINELLKVHYDQPREVPYIGNDEEPASLAINQPGTHPKTGEPIHFKVEEGDFGVTISTGPSKQSQHQEASYFADQLAQIPEVFSKIGDLVVKLKNLGPYGDAMAERLAPPNAQGMRELSPQAQAIIGELQEQLTSLQAFAQKMFAEANDKQADRDLKKYTVDQQEATKRVIGLEKVNLEEAQTVLEHELGITHKKVDQAHEISTAEAAREHESGMQATQQAHESTTAEQDRQAALEQQKQAADLAPKATE